MGFVYPHEREYGTTCLLKQDGRLWRIEDTIGAPQGRVERALDLFTEGFSVEQVPERVRLVARPIPFKRDRREANPRDIGLHIMGEHEGNFTDVTRYLRQRPSGECDAYDFSPVSRKTRYGLLAAVWIMDLPPSCTKYMVLADGYALGEMEDAAREGRLESLVIPSEGQSVLPPALPKQRLKERYGSLFV